MNTNCGFVFPDQDGNRSMDPSDLNPKINSESIIQKHFLKSAGEEGNERLEESLMNKEEIKEGWGKWQWTLNPIQRFFNSPSYAYNVVISMTNLQGRI